MGNGGLRRVMADLVASLVLVAVLTLDALVVYVLLVEAPREKWAPLREIGVLQVLGFWFVVQLMLCIFGFGWQYVRCSAGANFVTHVLRIHLVALVATAVAAVAIGFVLVVMEHS